MNGEDMERVRATYHPWFSNRAEEEKWVRSVLSLVEDAARSRWLLMELAMKGLVAARERGDSELVRVYETLVDRLGTELEPALEVRSDILGGFYRRD